MHGRKRVQRPGDGQTFLTVSIAPHEARLFHLSKEGAVPGKTLGEL